MMLCVSKVILALPSMKKNGRIGVGIFYPRLRLARMANLARIPMARKYYDFFLARIAMRMNLYILAINFTA